MPRITQQNVEQALKGAFRDASERSRRTGVPLIYQKADGTVMDEVPPRPSINYNDLPAPESSVIRDEPSDNGD